MRQDKLEQREKKDRFEEQKKKRRNELLIAGLEVFREKGFHNTRIKDITKRADTATGNFYNYFDSKEHIFEHLITEFYEMMKKRLEELNEQDVPRISSIKELFRSYLKMFLNQKEIALVFIEQLGGAGKRFTEMKYDFIDKTTRITAKIISRLVERGIAREQNPLLTANAWTGTLFESFRWWVRHGREDISKEEWVDSIVEFLVNGTVCRP